MTHETTHAGRPKTAPPADTVNRLAVEIRILNSLVTKLTMRDLEQRVADALPGISLLQFGVLRLLSREQMTLSELSTMMMLTPSTLVPAVDKLERQNLVVRGKDPNDRRRTPLQLTDEARKALDSIPPAHPDDAIVQAINQLGEHKAAQLHKLLRELLHNLMPERDLYEEIIRNHPDHCGRH
jgi:DNA-binding MarR family transcriptional regulator